MPLCLVGNKLLKLGGAAFFRTLLDQNHAKDIVSEVSSDWHLQLHVSRHDANDSFLVVAW
eukprot:2055967-Amphidinium_carterae.1